MPRGCSRRLRAYRLAMRAAQAARPRVPAGCCGKTIHCASQRAWVTDGSAPESSGENRVVRARASASSAASRTTMTTSRPARIRARARRAAPPMPLRATSIRRAPAAARAWAPPAWLAADAGTARPDAARRDVNCSKFTVPPCLRAASARHAPTRPAGGRGKGAGAQMNGKRPLRPFCRRGRGGRRHVFVVARAAHAARRAGPYPVRPCGAMSPRRSGPGTHCPDPACRRPQCATPRGLGRRGACENGGNA